MNFKNSNLKCTISLFYGKGKLERYYHFVQAVPEYNDDLGDIAIEFNHTLVLDDLVLQAKFSAIFLSNILQLFVQSSLLNVVFVTLALF